MRWDNFGKFLAVSILIIGVFFVYASPLALSIKQGLDLQGGTHVVLEAVDTPDAVVNDDAINRVVAILERRVNELGLTEPLIQRQGSRRIIVELPGIKDPDSAIAMLGRTAMLEFKDPAGNTILTGKDLKDSRVQVDNAQNPLVGLEFNEEGTKKFAQATTRLYKQPISIVLDGEVLTAPIVDEAITTGQAVIRGQRSIEEAENLSILLRSGALPVKMEIVENRTVGPTLGQDSKEKSTQAFVIGVGCIVVFMLLYYRLSGLVATIALLLYVILLLGAIKLLDATLTLPGIAGIILSVGMAVDANVLIFERFKEELREGKTLRSAIDSGFKKAFATILDSNVTTLFVAAVLFYMSTGPVKGFAITLSLGIVISMFTAITITKFLLKSFINSGVVKNPKMFGA